MAHDNTYQDLLHSLNHSLKTSEEVFNDLMEMKTTINEMKKLDLYDNGKTLVYNLERNLIKSLENQIAHHQNMLKLLDMNQRVSHSWVDKLVKFAYKIVAREIKNKIQFNITKYQNQLKEITETC